MASAAAATPSRSSRSFAGLLEEYAAPPAKSPTDRPFDGLEDDVATLSYETALKAHARYQRGPDVAQPPATPVAAPVKDARLAREHNPQTESQFQHTDAAAAQSSPAPRKCASVTVRLTAQENELLRDRAAEAGLNVSAYLRSCAFEVESLRAQVKEAVAQMRGTEQQDPAPAPPRPWISRLFRRSPRA